MSVVIIQELVKARECSTLERPYTVHKSGLTKQLKQQNAKMERGKGEASETWTLGAVAKTYKRHTIQFLLLQLAPSLDMSTVGSA